MLLVRTQLMREFSEAARKAGLEARRRRAEAARAKGATRASEFVAWSTTHAKVWADWKLHCGRAQHDCEFCKSYREVTASIPFSQDCTDNDFEYLRGPR